MFLADHENLSFIKAELERKEKELEIYKKMFNARTSEIDMMRKRRDGM